MMPAATGMDVLLASQAFERPGSVLTDHGIRVSSSLLEPGHKPFIAGVAHGHREIARPALVFRSLHG